MYLKLKEKDTEVDAMKKRLEDVGHCIVLSASSLSLALLYAIGLPHCCPIRVSATIDRSSKGSNRCYRSSGGC